MSTPEDKISVPVEIPARPRPKVICGPGRTKQEFKKDADINVIIKKFQTTGIINFRNEHEAFYGDIDPLDFQDAMNTVAKAGEMFDALPANIRKKFGHDPAVFLEYIQDPTNETEARSLGLLSPDRTGVTYEPEADTVPDLDPVPSP